MKRGRVFQVPCSGRICRHRLGPDIVRLHVGRWPRWHSGERPTNASLAAEPTQRAARRLFDPHHAGEYCVGTQSNGRTTQRQHDVALGS